MAGRGRAAAARPRRRGAAHAREPAAPAAPARPTLTGVRRNAARALLLDEAGRVLLLRTWDPWDPAYGEFWVLPGGGVAPGETTAAAAARELAEETGLRVAAGPCVATSRAAFRLAGIEVDQHEHVHVAWLRDAVEGEPSYEGVEEIAVLGVRWWTAAELAATAEPVFPPGLAALVADLAAGRVPAEPRALGG